MSQLPFQGTNYTVTVSAGQGFPGLSPFTVWTIDFTQQANAWIDLSTIRTVRLTFTGTFR